MRVSESVHIGHEPERVLIVCGSGARVAVLTKKINTLSQGGVTHTHGRRTGQGGTGGGRGEPGGRGGGLGAAAVVDSDYDVDPMDWPLLARWARNDTTLISPSPPLSSPPSPLIKYGTTSSSSPPPPRRRFVDSLGFQLVHLGHHLGLHAVRGHHGGRGRRGNLFSGLGGERDGEVGREEKRPLSD